MELNDEQMSILESERTHAKEKAAEKYYEFLKEGLLDHGEFYGDEDFVEEVVNELG